ncbi:MAG: putative metal-binding motif-containing protein [Sandaracinaceae bacterium]|nr:putative metal-binding motif-containing protein [Sandaracinaceae bacterium]
MAFGRWHAVGLAVVLVTGCAAGNTESDAGSPRMDAASLPDSGLVDDDSGLADAAADAGSDAGPIDTTGMTCEPCRSDEDCVASHYCAMIGVGGRVCLPACVIDLPDCPARFDCVTSFSESIPMPVCAPVGERCCVDEDGDLHGTGVGCLGIDCDDEDAETHASAAEICDGQDNDCNGVVDDGDIATMCPRGDHVAATGCRDGGCTILECEPRFADCNMDARDGCETSTTTESSCGSCGVPCAPANATGDCAGGSCRIGACMPGYADCNMDARDGCETRLNSVLDCGGCGRSCSPAGAIGDCSTGTCAIGACDPNRGDCDGRAENGCETLLTTNSDCGACRMICAPSGGVGECSTGTCRLTTCTSPGTADCDGNAANGCETSIRTLTDCGGCGVPCSHVNGASTCDTGTCALAGCAPGYGNCDSVPGNGCEQRLNTVQHCGACGSPCTIANGTGDCSMGSCRVATCNPGWGNCDGRDDNGCEQRLDTLTHCGSCGASCSLTNASESCSTGACLVGSCNSGWGNCDGSHSNGCETNTNTSVAHCNTCGNACSLANANPTCAGGACAISSCRSGWCNLDGTVPNGCEHQLNPTPMCEMYTDLGTINGDTGGGTSQVEVTGRGTRWYRIRVRENYDLIRGLSVRATLAMPSTVDYDLTIYCSGCSGTSASSSATAGTTDIASLMWGDSWGSDDSRNIYIHVRYWSANVCDTYTLTVQGNVTGGNVSSC